MKFRTEITIPEFPFSVEHGDRILTLGSCFSAHMAERMHQSLFHVADNPFGTSYNPISLAQQLTRIQSGEEYRLEELRLHNELYFSFDHYTAFSHPDAETMLSSVNDALKRSTQSLPQAKVLMLTLGTAHAWKHRNLNQIVNNCHRLPGGEFKRILLTVPEIAHALQTSINNLTSQNPDLNVLLTVSPVRHLRDGAIPNQRSKAILLVAAHELAESLDNVHYFPSYELMMDDLRDYRFYASDLLHPSNQAVEYIWQKFSGAVLSKSAIDALPKMQQLVRFLDHRPVNPQSSAHRASVERMQAELLSAKERIPQANWSWLEAALKKQGEY